MLITFEALNISTQNRHQYARIYYAYNRNSYQADLISFSMFCNHLPHVSQYISTMNHSIALVWISLIEVIYLSSLIVILS